MLYRLSVYLVLGPADGVVRGGRVEGMFGKLELAGGGGGGDFGGTVAGMVGVLGFVGGRVAVRGDVV